MANALLIFLGAGFGGVFRYWVSNGAYYLLGRQFPYGTLVVNVSVRLTIEFFDTKEKVEPTLDHLSTILRPEHIIFWEAKANE
jgi:fluoride ion exporter CrcB/FEX